MKISMKGIIHIKFNSIRIRNKLLISYIVVVLLPVLLVGIFLTNGMKNAVIENSMSNTIINVKKIQTRIQEVFNIPVDISNRMFSDTGLSNLMITEYKSLGETVNAITNYKGFEIYRRQYSEVGNIRFYTVNDTLANNWTINKVTDGIRKKQWYKNAVEKDGIVSWEYLYDRSSAQYCLSLTRVIKNEDLKCLGVAVITVDSDCLYDVVKQEPFETVIELNGHIFASSNSSLLNKKFVDLHIAKKGKASNSDNIKDVIYDGKASKMISLNFRDKNGRGNFTIRSFIPISRITRETRKVSVLGFTIIGISLFAAGIMIIFFSNAISSRLNKLSRQMRKSMDEDFNAEIPIEIEGEDEIGKLSTDLNIMFKNIQRLVNEIYEMANQQKEVAIQQKDIEFKMLANQINPHFLYNALETIRMKCLSKNDEETATIVKLFAKLMRRNLEVSNGSVPLISELEFVKSYLDIQKYRFEDKVEYAINVLCDISKCNILPLIIQPIVENAFIHGLEAKSGNGQIIINVEKNDGMMDISVIDDGKGIAADKLEEINKNLEKCEHMESKRIGLFNVNSRIKLFYGKEYGIKIFSSPEIGTRIDILLPVEMEGFDYAKVINS